MTLKLTGVFASLVTPVDDDGHPLPEALTELTEFLIARGVSGLCVGGVASEYVNFDVQDRKVMISTVTQAATGRVPILSAIGASTMHRISQLACHSAEAGCAALLVAPPHFYRYEQRDLETFFRKIGSSTTLPCLIYSLPGHSNPLDIDTSQRLLLTAQNMIGLTDASGETKYLPRLAMAREQSDFSLLVADDLLDCAALGAGWDGMVSSAACLCPELVAKLYKAFRNGDRRLAQEYQTILEELLQELSQLPEPWGLRVGLGVRGIPTGPLALPLAPFRKQQIAQFREWLAGWLDRRREIFG
jgi:dihydrodipicolinate synthase/N-acetylneuraminate lyase